MALTNILRQIRGSDVVHATPRHKQRAAMEGRQPAYRSQISSSDKRIEVFGESVVMQGKLLLNGDSHLPVHWRQCCDH